MIIFFIFGEFMYIRDYTFKETTHCFLFILTSLCAVFINYTLRGVWSYNLIKLDQFKGWNMVSKSVIIMYLFSFMFYFFKYKNKDNFGLKSKELKKCILFFSGLINILFFHYFIYFYK